MVGTLPVAPVQLPIFRNRTYIRFTHLDSSLKWFIDNGYLPDPSGDFSSIYKDGVINKNVVGLLSAYAFRNSSWIGAGANSPSISNSGSTLIMESPSNVSEGGSVFSENKINLSKFSKLKFTGLFSVPTSATVIIGFTSDKNDNFAFVKSLELSTNSVSSSYEIDISDITGSYYFAVFLYHSGNGSANAQFTAITLG